MIEELKLLVPTVSSEKGYKQASPFKFLLRRCNSANLLSFGFAGNEDWEKLGKIGFWAVFFKNLKKKEYIWKKKSH
jgi:hypothetical protein